jgi:hypothetical protein
MIDVENETLLTPHQACKEFPGGISLPTFWRYVGPKGVRGARLESIVCGGKRWTSVEAISRFIASQNPDQSPAPAITPAQRKRQAEAARQELERIGV